MATYNASLTRGRQGRLLEDLATRQDRQAQRIAEVIQRTAPDVVLFQEVFSRAAVRGVVATGYPSLASGPSRTRRSASHSMAKQSAKSGDR